MSEIYIIRHYFVAILYALGTMERQDFSSIPLGQLAIG